MLALMGKLVCSCQTRELHMKHMQVLMRDSEETFKHTQVSAFECPV